MSSPWRVRNSSRLDGRGQSRTTSRPPGRSAAQAARRDPTGSAQLVQRVLEVGEVVRRATLSGFVTSAWWISIRSVRPAARRWRVARATESGWNSTPTSSSRREPAGHRDEPAAAAAVDVHDAAAARQVGDELRAAPPAPPEEDRDVLDGQPLDRRAVAVRSLRDRACPVRKNAEHPVPVERGDDRVDELAAEELRPGVVEQDDGDVLVELARPPSKVTSSWASAAHEPRIDGRATQPLAVASVRRRSGRPARRHGVARTARARRRGRPARSGGSRRGCRPGRRSGRRGPSCRRLSHAPDMPRHRPGTGGVSAGCGRGAGGTEPSSARRARGWSVACLRLNGQTPREDGFDAGSGSRGRATGKRGPAKSPPCDGGRRSVGP